MQYVDEERKKQTLTAVKGALKNLIKITGDENIIQLLGQKPMNDRERLPTGILTLDVATGGGITRGREVELFGLESSGKSLIAQKMVAAVQQHGGVCAYVDVEQTFDPSFAKKLGVNTNELLLSQPDSAQNAFNVIDALVDAGVDLIILDSIAALVPQEELDAAPGQQTVGLMARYMSQFLRRLNVKISRSGSVVVFTNQIRDAIGKYGGDPTTTPGGKAMKFYASVRIKVSKNKDSAIKGTKDRVIGQRIKARVVKNKTAPPFQVAEFEVYFDGRKLDDFEEVANTALRYGILPRYNAKGERTENGRQYRWESEPEFLAKSKAEVVEQLRKFPKVKDELLELIQQGNYNESEEVDDEDYSPESEARLAEEVETMAWDEIDEDK